MTRHLALVTNFGTDPFPHLPGPLTAAGEAASTGSSTGSLANIAALAPRRDRQAATSVPPSSPLLGEDGDVDPITQALVLIEDALDALALADTNLSIDTRGQVAYRAICAQRIQAVVWTAQAALATIVDPTGGAA